MNYETDLWREEARRSRAERDEALARIAEAVRIGKKIGADKSHVLEALKERPHDSR